VASPKRNDSASDEIGEMYAEYGGLLLWIAEVKFRVPKSEAEGVVQQAVLSLLMANTDIGDVRSWLVGATCNGSKHYWRRRILDERLVAPAAAEGQLLDEGLAERLERSFLVAKVLAHLSAGQREALRLHYFEGLTAAEIADRLDTTRRYAEKLIHRSLNRARAILERLARPPRGGDGKTSRPCARSDGEPQTPTREVSMEDPRETAVVEMPSGGPRGSQWRASLCG
jgi:RNA polymerase sigma-70 factor (ECF subfamily)